MTGTAIPEGGERDGDTGGQRQRETETERNRDRERERDKEYT